MPEHYFRYSSNAPLEIENVNTLEAAIEIETVATIVIKQGKEFTVKVKVPVFKAKNLVPVVPANQFVTSLVLRAYAFRAANFGAINHATPMVVGTPTQHPQRRKRGRRVIAKQVFQFPIHPFLNTNQVTIVVRSLHTFFSGNSLLGRRTLQAVRGPIVVGT